MSKKQIYLFCDAGMSTSIMVNKMMEVVEKHQMPLMITAFPIARAQEVVEAEKPVAILLLTTSPFFIRKNKRTICSSRDSCRCNCARNLWHDGWRKSIERSAAVN